MRGLGFHEVDTEIVFQQMPSYTDARPKGKDKITELRRDRSESEAYKELWTYNCTEEEDEFGAAIIIAANDIRGTQDSDGSHQKDKQVAVRKRQAVEMTACDQIRQRPMKYIEPWYSRRRQTCAGKRPAHE